MPGLIQLVILSVIVLLGLTTSASQPGASAHDIGSRIAKGTGAGATTQFLATPLPLSHFLENERQLGVSAGHTTVKAGTLTLSGPGMSLAYDHTVKQSFGLQGLLLVSQFNADISGTEMMLFPFANNVPIDAPEFADFSSGSGKVTFGAIGLTAVYDPILTDKNSSSLPLAAGVMFAKMRLDQVKAQYRMTTGANAGTAGEISFDGEANFVMPYLSAHFFYPVRDHWWIVPSIKTALSIATQPQKGRISGPGFDISGDTQSTGFTEANYKMYLISPGLTISYRPAKLSTNIGASVFKYFFPGLSYSGVEQTVLLHLSMDWDLSRKGVPSP